MKEHASLMLLVLYRRACAHAHGQRSTMSSPFLGIGVTRFFLLLFFASVPLSHSIVYMSAIYCVQYVRFGMSFAAVHFIGIPMQRVREVYVTSTPFGHVMGK